MEDFKGKTVVITGGATGIGYAFAKALGSEGATIVIAEPREHRLKEAVASLSELGITAHAKQCDVAVPDQVEALADFAWEKTGQVDALFNNAGIGAGRSSVADLPLEKLRKVFDVNFFGVWYGCAVFSKRMIEQATPAIIYNTASENAFFTAAPNMAAYVATKHAVLGMTEAFREEMPDFIKVGTIFPGFVNSELISPKFAQFAMDTDLFAAKCIEQIKAGEHFVVTHAYNIERVKARYTALENAFATYAPRYAGDDEYDVRTLLKR